MIRFGGAGGPHSIIVKLPHYYNARVTAHALIMIFFILMPGLIGLWGNWVYPLSIKAQDLAFPRLNLFSFMLLPWALGLLYLRLLLGGAGRGWTLNPPLSSITSPGVAVDATILTLHIRGIRRIAGSVNFLAATNLTEGKLRIGKWSPFTWTILRARFLLVLSLPVLAGGITINLLDRNFNTLFFEVEGGGNPILYQHLFWFFGHPEVYVLILPAFGVVTLIVQKTRGNKKPHSPQAMILAILRICFIGCLVWAHHIFTVGIDNDRRAYFSMATIVIAVPTGVKVFRWLSALNKRGQWGGTKISHYNQLINEINRKYILREPLTLFLQKQLLISQKNYIIFLEVGRHPLHWKLYNIRGFIIEISNILNLIKSWRIIWACRTLLIWLEPLQHLNEQLNIALLILPQKNRGNLSPSRAFTLGFIFIFTVGGVTGIMLSTV